MFFRSELTVNFDQVMQQGPKYHCRSYQRAGRTQFQRMPFGAIVSAPLVLPPRRPKVQKITGICWRQSVWRGRQTGQQLRGQSVSDGIGKLGPNITFQARVASNSGQAGGQVGPPAVTTKLLESQIGTMQFAIIWNNKRADLCKD